MKLSSLLAWPVICFVVPANSPLAAQPADAANKAKLKLRDQFWEQAAQAVNKDKLNDATMLFEKAYVLEESVFGPAHPNLIRTLAALTELAAYNPR